MRRGVAARLLSLVASLLSYLRASYHRKQNVAIGFESRDGARLALTGHALTDRVVIQFITYDGTAPAVLKAHPHGSSCFPVRRRAHRPGPSTISTPPRSPWRVPRDA